MREILFGSRELTEYYRKSLALIHQYKLYQSYKLEVNKTEALLILFNCFRYSRDLVTNKLSVEYLNLKSGKWEKDRVIHKSGSVFKFSHCPDISCLKGKKWLLYYAMHCMLNQVKTIVNHHKIYTNFDRLTPIKGRLTLDVIDSIIKKYICRNNVVMKNQFNHEKHITKWLWQHFFDRSLISIVSRIERLERVNLSSCIYYQIHISKIDRISAEYPNLLPLLSEIPTKLWSDPNLFSFNYWVDKTQPYINVLASSRTVQRKISQLSQKSHWRWLKKQSPLVIREWGWNGCGCDLSSLTQHGITEKIPVCVIRQIIRHSHMFTNYAEHQTAVVRLLILHTLHIWKHDGIKTLHLYLKNELSSQLNQLEDYWEHEGRRHGIPATWTRFVARSTAWHEQILAEQRRADDEEYNRLIESHWDSPIQSHTMNDSNITFTALNNGKALLEEGQRMRHCVFSYTYRCIEQNYLVFSTRYLSDGQKEAQYATLGLLWNKSEKNWKVQQHWGPCNSNIPDEIQKAGQAFCRLINQA